MPLWAYELALYGLGETMAVCSPVALPAAILNELLHPGTSKQHGALGNTLKKNSLPCRVYILKRLEISP